MKEVTWGLALARRLGVTATAGALALTAMAALSSSALAAGSVKVATSYVQTPISANKDDAILFAISNSTGSTVSNLTFTDALPAGTVLGDPVGLGVIAGATTTCGTVTAVNPATGVVSAPGDGTVAITVASVPSAASGAICTLTLGIVSSVPTADAPVLDTLTSSYTTPKPVLTPAGITVLSDPTLSINTPKKQKRFGLGQIVASNFGCSATDALDSISNLFATDDYSNQISSGEAIDTVDPGSNTLQVNCYSAAGSIDITHSVTYKVSSYAAGSVKTDVSKGLLTFATLVPAGRFVTELLVGKHVIGASKVTVHYRHNTTVPVTLNASGKAMLAAGKRVKAKLVLSFMPTAVGIGPDRITASAPIVVTKALTV